MIQHTAILTMADY